MKCLCVITKYWPSVGGSEMHTREIMKRLSKWMQVQVACYCTQHHESNEVALANNEPKRFLDGPVDTIHFGPKGIVQWLLRQTAPYYAKNLFAKALFTLITMLYARTTLTPLVKHNQVVHLVYNGVTPIAEVAQHLAKRYHKRFVITPLLSFGLDCTLSHPGKRLLSVIKNADAVIALTDFEKAYLASLGVDPSRISVTPVGALLEQPKAVPTFAHNLTDPAAPVILFLARHVKGKGYHLVLDAMPLVWQHHPNAQFVYLGPKSADVEAQIIAINDPRIISINNPDQALKTEALEACTMLCVPTFHEGLGGVFIEAWCNKKPVISGAIPLLDTVISHQKDGLLVPHTATDVALAIRQLLDHPEQAKQMGEAGYLKSSSRYHWSAISKRIHALYVSSNPNLVI